VKSGVQGVTALHRIAKETAVRFALDSSGHLEQLNVLAATVEVSTTTNSLIGRGRRVNDFPPLQHTSH